MGDVRENKTGLTPFLLSDLSVVKALTHAAIATKQRLKIEWIEASSLHDDDDPAG